MTRRASYAFAAVLFSTLLAACGGGGTEVTKYTFDLQEAWANQTNDTATYNFTMSGWLDFGDCVVSVSSEPGSGVFTLGAVLPGTFETIDGFQKQSVADVPMIMSGCGVDGIAPFNLRYTDYFDRDYLYLGRIDQSDFFAGCPYMVASNQVALPTDAKVGDSGQMFTMEAWDSAAKTQSCGLVTVSYSVAADTANTVLFKITYSDDWSSETLTFRVDTASQTTLVSIQDDLDGGGLTINFY